jgi:hypothetical protein
MKAPIKPIYKATLDGIDDQITLQNTGVSGNPYDYEYNSVLTWCIQFTVTKFANNASIKYPVAKTGNGFQFSYYTNPGQNQLTFGYQHSTGSTYVIVPYAAFSPINNQPLILFGTSSGTGTSAGILLTVYNGVTGTYILTGGTGAGVLAGASIKNTNPYKITGDPMIFSHLSMWNNVVMSAAQKDNLAARILNRTVEGHALYSSNCVGYWKEYLPGTLVNVKDQTYNGVFSGFEKP